MASSSSQKFIGKNRAPRVQIEYDVELNGAEKKVNLPFVMGVMYDLSGKSKIPLPPVEERRMMEIGAENFDDRLKGIAPRAAFNVPNTLTGEGNIAVDMTFESMDDFSPGKVVSKVDGLKQLMEARQQLSNLLSYMDGKSGAEELLNKILSDPALLKALAAKAKENTPAEGDAPAAEK
jgi:type VI secretion system protein ImpB